MSLRPDAPDVTRRLRRLSQISAVGALGIACVVLVGWSLGMGPLKGMLPGLVAMKPNTAICVLCSGAAVALFARRFEARKRQLLVGLACVPVVLSALTLFEHGTGINLGIDEAVFLDPDAATPPGRTSVQTAAGFLALAVALLCSLGRSRRLQWAAQLLTIGVAANALLAFAGFLFGASALVDVAVREGRAAMGLHVSVAFLLISNAILLAQTEVGLGAVLASRFVGGDIVRQTFPLAICLPLAIGALGVAAEEAGLYDARFSVAVNATLVALVFATLIIAAGRWLNRTDAARREADRARDESNQFGREIIRSLQEGIAVLDRQFRHKEWTPRMEELTGIPAAKVLGRTPQEVFPGFQHDESLAGLRRALAGEVVEMPEREFLRPTGESLWLRRSYVPLRSAAGEVMGVIVNVNNVTDRKRAEQEREESRAQLERILRTAPDGIIAIDTAGRIGFFNPAAEKMFGCPAGQANGRSINEFVPGVAVAGSNPPPAGPTIPFTIGSVEVHLARRVDGHTFTVEVSVDPMGPGNAHTFIVRDVSARIAAEQALRESEARFRQLAENIDSVFWIRDPATPRLLYVSPAFDRIWGATPTDRAAAAAGWLETVHPDDRPRVEQAATRHRLTGGFNETFRIVRGDGAVRWVQSRSFPVRDEKGAVLRIVGTASDVTERRQLEAQLRQAQKMEAIGTLAGGIAHDFNNILAGITGYTELARLALDPREEQIHTYLNAVTQAGWRASDLVRQILAFSRRQESARQPLPLRPIVEEALQLLRATLPATIELKSELADVPPILGEGTQLHQVIMNLATNAWHAMRDRSGRLETILNVQTILAGQAAQDPRLRRGRFVHLRMADTGHGMDRATLERIFEPFFTTKPPGEGTGLGLSVVHGIIHHHDGFLTVQSEPGQGTRFDLYFPLAEAPVGRAVKSREDVPRGDGQRVLVIDDEVSLARLCEDTLNGLGYEAEAYVHPAEALERLVEAGETFAAVITDQTMPGMTGEQLAQRIKSMRPQLPVLLITGYTGNLTQPQKCPAGVEEVLLKPYTRFALADAVARATRSGQGAGDGRAAATSAIRS